jgi:hypothetical protein
MSRSRINGTREQKLGAHFHKAVSAGSVAAVIAIALCGSPALAKRPFWQDSSQVRDTPADSSGDDSPQTSASSSAQATQPTVADPRPGAVLPEAVPDAPSVQKTSVLPKEPLTFKVRAQLYGESLVDPGHLFLAAVGTGIDQWSNRPPEWGQGGAGLGRRFGSYYGRLVIGRTIKFGVSAADHEDIRYYAAPHGGFGYRIKWAVAQTFVSRNDAGAIEPAYSRFIGLLASAFIANAWEPPSEYGSGKAMERFSVDFASSVGWHVFAEFSPKILRRGRGRGEGPRGVD